MLKSSVEKNSALVKRLCEKWNERDIYGWLIGASRIDDGDPVTDELKWLVSIVKLKQDEDYVSGQEMASAETEAEQQRLS